MALVPVGADNRADLEAFLVAHADPVDGLLYWADLREPLARLATAWLWLEGNTCRAVAFAFPLWPTRPALGVLGRTAADEQALLSALVAQRAVGPGYVICAVSQRPLWDALGLGEDTHLEHHMLLDLDGWQPTPREGVRAATLPELADFYQTHQAGAWHPIQYETGPYMLVEHDGAVVAAAGTHFAYPGLAQLGNVLTAPNYRGRGLAARVTSGVIDALAALGYARASLFVNTDNQGATRVYERLGFSTRRDLEAFCWTPFPATP